MLINPAIVLLTAALLVLLAALQLRLRWHSVRRSVWKNYIPDTVDADTRAPPVPVRPAASYSDALLIDHWGSPEPD